MFLRHTTADENVRRDYNDSRLTTHGSLFSKEPF